MYKELDVFNELYLVDGDNHVYEGLEGIENLGTVARVIVFFTQEGLCNNLVKRYGKRFECIRVKPGNQAVDNRIKEEFGNRVKVRKRHQKIYIISHDNGYKKLIGKYQRRYNLSPKILSLRKAIKYCN